MTNIVALVALGRGLYAGVGLLYRSFGDGETNLGASMLDVVERLLGM